MGKQNVKLTGDGSSLSKMFSGLRKDLASTGKQAKAFANSIKSNFNNTEKEVKKKTSKMKDSIKSFNDVMNVGMMAFATKSTMDFVSNIEKQNLGMEILKTKNKELYEVVARTSQITGGLGDKFEMMAAANKALGFKVVNDAKQFERMMKATSKVALIAGESAGKMMNDLMTGVARRQKLILDNMQINIPSMNKLYDEFAKSINKTTKELTEEEKTTSILNESLKQMEENTKAVTDEMIAKNTKMTKSFKVITDALRILAGLIVDVLQDLAVWSEHLGETFLLTGSFAEALVMELTGVGNEIRALNKEIEDTKRITASMYNIQRMYHMLNFEIVKAQQNQFRMLKKGLNDYLKWSVKVYEEAEEKKRSIVFSDKEIATYDKKYNELLRKEREYQAKKKSIIDSVFNINKKKASSKDFKNDINLYLEYLDTEDKQKRQWLKDRSLSISDLKTMLIMTEGQKEIDAQIEKDKIKNDKIIERMHNNMKIVRDSISEELEDEKEQKRLAILDSLQFENELTQWAYEQKRLAISARADAVKGASDSGNYSEAQRLEIQGLRNFYADKMNTTIEMEAAIARVKHKYQKLASDEQLKGLKTRKDVELMAMNTTLRASQQFFRMLVGNEKNKLKTIAKMALSQAGSEIFADGVKRTWIGGGMLINPITAPIGAMQVAYGVAEMSIGLGMGSLASNIEIPKATTEKPESSQKIEGLSENNKFKEKEIEQEQKRMMIDIAMYPDEREYVNKFQKTQDYIAYQNGVER